MQLHIAAATWQIQTNSDSAVRKITSVLVDVIIIFPKYPRY